mgnify:CR=1 FL=1
MTIAGPPALELAEDKLQHARPASIWRDTLGNLRRQRNAAFGGAILLFFVTVALFADQIATHEPTMILIGVEEGAKKMTPPCIHLLGCPESRAASRIDWAAIGATPARSRACCNAVELPAISTGRRRGRGTDPPRSTR